MWEWDWKENVNIVINAFGKTTTQYNALNIPKIRFNSNGFVILLFNWLLILSTIEAVSIWHGMHNIFTHTHMTTFIKVTSLWNWYVKTNGVVVGGGRWLWCDVWLLFFFHHYIFCVIIFHCCSFGWSDTNTNGFTVNETNLNRM